MPLIFIKKPANFCAVVQ